MKTKKTQKTNSEFDWVSDDITFCLSECENVSCFRNQKNIRYKDIPHSFSNFEGTQYCAKEKTE